MQNIEIPYLLLRLWVGAYFIYWGLNSFFYWQAIPPGSVQFERFIGRLLAIPLLMNLVKTVEIGAGVLLVTGFCVDLGLAGLLPIVTVIVGSHLILNFARGWRVAFLVLLPYFLLVVAYFLRV